MKVVRCKELGFDCPGVVKAPDEDEALRQVAEHARQVHGIEQVTPEMADKVRGVMRDEP